MWYSNDMFHNMFKAEFVRLVSVKVPSGRRNFPYISTGVKAILALKSRTSPLCDERVNVHELLDEERRLVEPGLLLVQHDHDDAQQGALAEAALTTSAESLVPARQKSMKLTNPHLTNLNLFGETHYG